MKEKSLLSLKIFIFVLNQGTLSSEKRAACLFGQDILLLSSPPVLATFFAITFLIKIS